MQENAPVIDGQWLRDRGYAWRDEAHKLWMTRDLRMNAEHQGEYVIYISGGVRDAAHRVLWTGKELPSQQIFTELKSRHPQTQLNFLYCAPMTDGVNEVDESLIGMPIPD